MLESVRLRIIFAFAVLAGLLFTVVIFEKLQPVAVSQVRTSTTSSASSSLTGASTTITISYARTPREQQKGLSGRPTLPENEGLLFVFPVQDRYPFWMPDMHFAIDIIWIDKDKQIVYIAPNVSTDSYPQLFTPSSPALYVLEVNAGKAKEWGWDAGTSLSFD